MPRSRQTHFFAYMPRVNATARQRAYLVAEGLAERGDSLVRVHAPLRDSGYSRYLIPSGILDKSLWLVEMLVRRSVQVLRVPRGSVVVIQRELLPVGPATLERVLRRKASQLIVDIDDATYAFAESRPHSRAGRMLLTEGKFDHLCTLADLVVCGNDELAMRASRSARAVTVIPTSLEFPPMPDELPGRNDGALRLGWLGNPGNLSSLATLAEPIRRLRAKGLDVRLHVMSARNPTAPETDGLDVEFVRWGLEEEDLFLSSVDVGVMPLTNDEYSRGKCGFKLLRYIAAGVPVMGSPVGVNAEILQGGANGVVVGGRGAWEAAITQFASMSRAQRSEMAQHAYEWACSRYSLAPAVAAWRAVLWGESV